MVSTSRRSSFTAVVPMLSTSLMPVVSSVSVPPEATEKSLTEYPAETDVAPL